MYVENILSKIYLMSMYSIISFSINEFVFIYSQIKALDIYIFYIICFHCKYKTTYLSENTTYFKNKPYHNFRRFSKIRPNEKCIHKKCFLTLD